MKNEAKVGAVILLALAALLGGYGFLRGLGRGGDTYKLLVQSGAANIQSGSDVRLRGVKIGEVREVALDTNTQKPLLTLAIQKQNPPIALQRDYEYSLRSGSLIGENYVDIRGNFDNAKPRFSANSEEVIPATAVGGVADVATQVAGISQDFGVTLQKLNVTIDRINKGILSYDNQIKLARALEGVAKLTQQAQQGFGPNGVKVSLGDPNAQRALNETLRNTSAAARNINNLTRDFGGVARNANTLTQNAGALTDDLRNVVGQNSGQLRGLVANLNGTARNINGLTESLAFVVEKGGFKENSQLAFRSLRRAAENVEVGTQGLRAFGDPAAQKTLRETLESVNQATGALRDTAVTVRDAVVNPQNREQLAGTFTTLNQTAKSLQGTVQNLNEITGALKNVAVDPQVQSDLKATVANLNGTLVATRVAAERVSGLLGGRKSRSTETSNNTPNGESDATSSTRSDAEIASDKFSTGVDFTLRRYTNARTEAGRTFGDATLNTELFSRPLRLGISGVGEDNDLTIQSGAYLGRDKIVRYGLYRSKLGVGGEIKKGKFSLEGNVYDPNDASYNAYVGYKISDSLEIIAGREKRDGVRTNALGVRLRQ